MDTNQVCLHKMWHKRLTTHAVHHQTTTTINTDMSHWTCSSFSTTGCSLALVFKQATTQMDMNQVCTHTKWHKRLTIHAICQTTITIDVDATITNTNVSEHTHFSVQKSAHLCQFSSIIHAGLADRSKHCRPGKHRRRS